MLAKQKTLIFCILKTGGEGRPNQNCLKIPKMSDFLFELTKKIAYFEGFEEKRVGGGDFIIVFRRQNMSEFFLCKHP